MSQSSFLGGCLLAIVVIVGVPLVAAVVMAMWNPTNRFPADQAPQQEPAETNYATNVDAALAKLPRTTADPIQDASPAPEKPVLRRSEVFSGQDAVIDRPGPGGGALLAVDAKAWEEMIAAQVNGNVNFLDDLASEGRIFGLRNGQLVRVRERAINSALVRVAGGRKEGQSGWVQVEFLVPSR